jgi:hypothetical protein
MAAPIEPKDESWIYAAFTHNRLLAATTTTTAAAVTGEFIKRQDWLTLGNVPGDYKPIMQQWGRTAQLRVVVAPLYYCAEQQQ